MANEFIIKNGFHSKGDSQVTGSLNVSSTLTVNGSTVGAAFPFSGDAQITGSLNVSSSITTFDINMSTWTLGADGGNNYYYFTGPGDLGGTEQNPDIHLTRGQKYRFYNPMDAHPFQIQDTGGSAFSTGVTNNGVQLGFLSFDVPMDGPTHLKYQCTAHAAMVGNIYIADARVASGSFSGSFQGDGSSLTGISSTPFPFTGDAQITGSLTVSGSGNITSSLFGYMLITSSNTGGSTNAGMTPGLVINQVGSGQNHSGPAIRLVNSTNGEETNIYHHPGGSGADHGNGLNILTDGGINIEAGDDLGSSNKFFRIAKGQALITIDDDSSAPRTDVKIHNGNGGTAYSRLSLGASSEYWYIEADDNDTPFNIGFDNGSSDTDVITFTKHNGSLTGSFAIIGGPLKVTGSAIISSSNSDIALTVQGSGSTVFNIIGSEGTLFAIEDDLDGTLFTVNDRSGIPMFEVSASGRIVAEEGESIIRSQRPIVTHTSNFSITSSLDFAGKYHIVGGSITCSINTGSLVPTGAEFEFFQTSSAGNFLFITGSPHVDVIVKNDNMNLAGQGSGASLKYIGGSTFHLVGDLT